MKLLTPYLALSVAGLATGAVANEWPSFRGPNQNGIVAAPASVSDWSRVRVKTLWTEDTPDGFSSFAVAGAKAFTVVTGEADGNPSEMLRCLDVRNGDLLWETPLAIVAKYDGGGNAGEKGNDGGDGPRSTPVVDDGHVYCIDANLGVHCISAEDGSIVWQHDVMDENNGENIKWQNAASPLIVGDLLLMAGGGRGQALLGIDKKTGDVRWKGEDDKMTHATPIPAEIHGVPQVIFFTQEGLVSVDPTNGDVYWRAEFPFKVSTAASPVVFEDIVYCSAGYGVGAGAFKISKSGSSFSAEQIWRRENECFNHWSTPVMKDGYLYGMFSFKEYGVGPVACVDIRTGEDMWKEEGFGPGQVILAGETVIALSDKGELVTLETNPEEYVELSRKDILDGKVWSYPVLAYDRLFARSTTEGVCIEFQ